MKTCPLCGTPLTRLVASEGYRVERVVLPMSGRIVEQKRMDVIYVCPRCEHCQ